MTMPSLTLKTTSALVNEICTELMAPCRTQMVGEASARRVGTPRITSPALFQGVKRKDWRARPEAALKLGRKLAGRGEIAYRVVPPERLPSEGKGLTGARTRGGARVCARPNCSTEPIASCARAGSATGLATVCASRLRATSRFRANSRCISTRRRKCAPRP